MEVNNLSDNLLKKQTTNFQSNLGKQSRRKQNLGLIQILNKISMMRIQVMNQFSGRLIHLKQKINQNLILCSNNNCTQKFISMTSSIQNCYQNRAREPKVSRLTVNSVSNGKIWQLRMMKMRSTQEISLPKLFQEGRAKKSRL